MEALVTSSRLPLAVLDDYDRLLKKQATEKAEFQKRVNAARGQLLERHVNEQQEFWAKRPQAAENAAPHSSQRQPDQQSSPMQPKAPANASKRAANAMPHTTRTAPSQNAAHAKGRTGPEPKPTHVEVIDLMSSDDETEPQQRSKENGTQSKAPALASPQQAAFIPPMPIAIKSFVGNNSKAFQPYPKDEEDLSSQDCPLSGTLSVTTGASANTLPHQIPTHGLPLGPIPLQSDSTLGGSVWTSPRKRRVEHCVSDFSSDDGVSDFEPSSGDDDMATPSKKHTPKKGKAMDGSGVAKPTFRHSKKNTYGFKAVTLPIPNHPSKSPLRNPFSESPSLRAVQRKNPPTGMSSSQLTSSRLPNTRRAKLQARANLEEQAQKDAEWRSEKDIREADEMEHRLKGAEEPKVTASLRHLSITPVPAQTRGAVDGETVYSGLNWTNDRMRGDRYLSKKSLGGRGDEES